MKSPRILLFLLIFVSASFAVSPQDLPTHLEEGSNGFVGTIFKDQNGIAHKPDGILHYFVSDEATGTVLQADAQATITPTGPTQQFQINRCANRIVGVGPENRLITFAFSYGGSGQFVATDYARYTVDDIPDLRVSTPSGTPGQDCTVLQQPTPTP